MRFIVAIVLFVVAFVSMALGIAQRTFLAGPSKVTETAVVDSAAPVTVIDGAALNAHDGTQSISVAGPGDVFIAYGRTVDVMAWVGDASYAELTPPSTPESTEFEVETVPGLEMTVPNPTGSDLWIQEFSGEGELTRKLNVPTDVSVIIAGDGQTAAPSTVSVTWPIDNSTPWAVPLILGGIAALLAGIVALLWALVHARKVRGPRRKTPRMPRNPKPPRLKPSPQRRALESPEKVGASHGRRRLFGVVGAVAVSAVALAGCSMPGDAGSSPSPSDSSIGENADLESPAVTTPQLKRILSRISDSLVAADEAKDPKLLDERLAGPALETRQANYKVLRKDAKQDAIAPIPNGSIDLVLPQQSDVWPRAVFAVVSDGTNPTAAPTALMLVQDSPRDNYKVHYIMSLDHDLPKVAPASIGAARLQADTPLLLMQPDALAEAYGDVLLQGEKSLSYPSFKVDGDNLLAGLGPDYKKDRKKKLGKSGKFEYTEKPGAGQVVAFATNDSGALVAVDLRENETVKPTEPGAAVTPKGAAKALSGKNQSTRGFSTNYAIQILFYVPPVTATDQKVQVLGFSQGLVSAAELR